MNKYMKQKILIFCLCMFFIFSCKNTEYQITNIIKPKITIIGDTVGLQYKLGDLLITDEFTELSTSMVQYIKDNKDDLIFQLKIEYDSFQSSNTYFYYYIEGIEIAETTGLSSEALLENKESIPNFLLFRLKGKVYNGTINIKEDFKENKIEQPSEQVVQEPKTANSRKL